LAAHHWAIAVGRDVAGGSRDLPSLILFVFVYNFEDLKIPRSVWKLKKRNLVLLE
jgi:hypothetical protein